MARAAVKFNFRDKNNQKVILFNNFKRDFLQL